MVWVVVRIGVIYGVFGKYCYGRRRLYIGRRLFSEGGYFRRCLKWSGLC